MINKIKERIGAIEKEINDMVVRHATLMGCLNEAKLTLEMLTKEDAEEKEQS